MSEKKEWIQIEASTNKVVKNIHVVAYVFNSEVLMDNVQLQLRFHDDSVLLLYGAGDGQSLCVSATEWTDPFAGLLDSDTLKFINVHGKHILVNMKDIHPYSTLIDGRLKYSRYIHDRFDIQCGVQLQIGNNFINFFIRWDEGRIAWGKFPSVFTTNSFSIHDKL